MRRILAVADAFGELRSDSSRIRRWQEFQKPACTELDALRRHSGIWLDEDVNSVEIYLGLPWASMIDFESDVLSESSWAGIGRSIRTCIDDVLLNHDGYTDIRVHTVCQHVYPARMADFWQSIGVTDLWLSHSELMMAAEALGIWSMRVHPWPLYAVVTAGSDADLLPFCERDVLCSFIGSSATGRLTEDRLNIQSCDPISDFSCIDSGAWFFEADVYGKAQEQSHLGRFDQYASFMARSKFILCPAGTGFNTIRFWEAISFGCVPVFFGRLPNLPNLEEFDFFRSASIVGCSKDLPELMRRLRLISPAEWRFRSEQGRRAFKAAQEMLCQKTCSLE